MHIAIGDHKPHKPWAKRILYSPKYKPKPPQGVFLCSTTQQQKTAHLSRIPTRTPPTKKNGTKPSARNYPRAPGWNRHHQDYSSLWLGNPNINLHLWLAYWVEHRPNLWLWSMIHERLNHQHVQVHKVEESWTLFSAIESLDIMQWVIEAWSVFFHDFTGDWFVDHDKFSSATSIFHMLWAL